ETYRSLCFRFDTGIRNGSSNFSVQNGRENGSLYFQFDYWNQKWFSELFSSEWERKQFSSWNSGLEIFSFRNSELEKKHLALGIQNQKRNISFITNYFITNFYFFLVFFFKKRSN
ncbi:hypothetical protein C1645_876252, partial [Glomus cerebriforme]